VFEALASGDIDAYVEYSGTIWTNQMKRTDVKPRAEVLDEVRRWLETNHRIALLGALGFENAYALAVSRQRADALGLRTVGDLARHAPQLTIAGDYEFFGRPEWQALRQAYGLAFRSQRTMQPEFMYPAVAAGEVDVISAYTSDGRVAQFDLRVLDDDKRAIPPYDAVLLISPRRAGDAALLEALRPLLGKLDVETMRDANRRAQTESPETIARAVWEKIAK
jgi:osmoprotectant transport system permease protein